MKTGQPRLVSYSPNAPGNDCHLQATDTVARDAGLSLASYFTTDRDGIYQLDPVSGVQAEYGRGTLQTLEGITAGPGGNLWFTR